ncbi:hypothetical protein [Nocardiopsis aegyptia]|uniref:Restriction endonuclease type IV Mrr domain-containing protein n=1 Tax=Nocardiopsis aegyptia TaxID=220378 RepID=A0A7Z0ESH1_9ACTN|nr:hypothetical protein [Nocardiopsis aegyptia]NYJ37499.1 hypothetical protein [Nocardiopsis aegyptia]
MRVTEYFDIPYKQHEIDFVDVDVVNDVVLFVDPRALTFLESEWAHGCISRIQSFFQYVIECMQEGKDQLAKNALSLLKEPDETHLGYSTGRSRGSGLGDELAERIWEAFSGSKAISSGLLRDLEDTALFVDQISSDRISDITINLIREHLIWFTQESAQYYGIPLQKGLSSGPVWDSHRKNWKIYHTELPMAEGKPLLLVPKSIVRQDLHFNSSEYYRHYILEFLRHEELQNMGSLVHVLKNGNHRVYKKDLERKYGVGKHVNLSITLHHPEVLENYRRTKESQKSPPLSHEDLSQDEPPPDWQAMLSEVKLTTPGKAEADAYHKRVEKLLTALFYPFLTDPRREFPINDKRKRIDITYLNSARYGFFNWILTHHPAPYVIVECKNYSRPLGNEEFDQLAGRFAPHRGKVGMLLYRGFGDKSGVIAHCRDIAREQKGFVLPLDDDDLAELAREAEESQLAGKFTLLQERFREIVD